MKNFIYAIVFVLLIFISSLSSIAYAASGACSGHGGVDCSAGAGTSGNVICNDGWTESSASYDLAGECKASQNNQSIIADNLFALKQRCASYTRTIQNELLDLNASSQANAKIHPGTDMYVTLDEMFYSPVLHSCLYTERAYIKLPSISVGLKTIPASVGTTYFIRDYLNNESQVYAIVVNDTDINASQKTEVFDNKVNYYKGDTPSQSSSKPILTPLTQSQVSQTLVVPSDTPGSPENIQYPPGLAKVIGNHPATFHTSVINSEKSKNGTVLSGYTIASGTQPEAHSIVATSTAALPQPKNPSVFERIFHFIASYFKLF